MTPRKKGAQPGNLNAFKHGLYSEQLRSRFLEVADSEALDVKGLQSEIAMLRKLIAHTGGYAEDVEDVDVAVKLLGALSMAGGRLSAMLRTQQILDEGSGDEDLDAIKTAIREVREEIENESRTS
jgi:hypothetical protein